MERDDGIIPSNLREMFQIKIFMNGSDGVQYVKKEFRMPFSDGNVFTKEMQIPKINWQKEYYFNLRLQVGIKCRRK